MKRVIFFFVAFLLLISLAAAADVSTDKSSYNSGEKVSITVSSCVGTPIIEVRNPDNDLVDIKSGLSMSYNTLSDSADGKYTVSAACSDGTVQKNFCVDAPGCLTVSETTTEEEPSAGTAGGGGTACTPNWSCDDWSFCGSDLTQIRSCFDLNGCQAEKEETQSCAVCQESWVCSIWAECSAGTQIRVCYDEHSCETVNNKPALQKECNEIDISPLPASISMQLPPPYVPPAKVVVKQSFLSKVWGNYKFYIIGGAAAVLLAVIILLVVHFLMPKKVAYNINELKQWVRKEKEMGTSDNDIREILKQNTGWTDEEIDMAFESQQPSRTVSSAE